MDTIFRLYPCPMAAPTHPSRQRCVCTYWRRTRRGGAGRGGEVCRRSIVGRRATKQKWGEFYGSCVTVVQVAGSVAQKGSAPHCARGGACVYNVL